MNLRIRKRKPLLDETNSIHNSSVLNRDKIPSKPNHKLSKNANNNRMQVKKILRVSLERNPQLENVIKMKNQMDVYNFTYDPDEEPVKKIKKGRHQQLIDDSGDENNSMKEVVHRLRLKDQQKKKAKVVKKRVEQKKINTQLHTNITKTKVNKENITEINGKRTHINNVNNRETATKNLNDENEVLHRLRLKDQEKKKANAVKKQAEQCKQAEHNVNNRETATKSLNDENKVKKLIETTKEYCENFVNDNFDCFQDDYENINTPSDFVCHTPSTNCQKTIQEEICDSFLNDLDNYDDTSTHLGPQNILSHNIMKSLESIKRNIGNISIENNSTKIDILSNILIEPAKTEQRQMSNSTMKSIVENSNPWRLSLSCKSPHTFTVKDKSIVPNYDQDIVINSLLADKIFTPESNSISKKDKFKETNDKENLIKNTCQTSMLNFVSSSKENKKEVVKSGRIFESPRKILGEINFMQSTPFQPNIQKKIKSPNYSIIEFEEKENKKAISDLFGFSCDENSENIDPKSVKKSKVLKKRTPKKEKLKTVLFNNVVEVKHIENVKETEEEMYSLPAADIDVLFQDIENDAEKLHVKKSRRSYERVKPKRKRLPSVESNESDDEHSIIEIRVKEKQMNKRTKKEEEEAEKLALHYNSMFEEIDKHTLCID